MPGNNLVIVGATGLVGRTFLKVLEERRFPVDKIKLLASSRSAGKQLEFKGDRITVQEFSLDQFEKGDMKGNFFGLVCAAGLAVGAVIIRSVKQINLVPSAMMGKLMVALIALLFTDNLNLEGNDTIIIPTMCIMCVAIPFVLVTLAPRYITAAEVNLFFLLETILGPIWVWLVIHEQPSMETIIGGIVIISTITVHSFLALKKT